MLQTEEEHIFAFRKKYLTERRFRVMERKDFFLTIDAVSGRQLPEYLLRCSENGWGINHTD
jgi:hypothetical protein